MIHRILEDIPHEIRQFPAKTIMLEAGNVATDIFLVKSGCVRSWYNADGKDITLQFFMPEQPVASFESLVNSEQSEYTIETVLPSEVIIIKGLDFKGWLTAHPEYHFEGLLYSLDRLASYQKLFLSRIKDTPQERYEELLKEHPEILSQIPQRHIASYLGITPVSLSRIRARFAKSK